MKRYKERGFLLVKYVGGAQETRFTLKQISNSKRTMLEFQGSQPRRNKLRFQVFPAKLG